MDDEYRAFLESAWNSTDDALADIGVTLNTGDKGVGQVINEVVEIEADDAEPAEEAAAADAAEEAEEAEEAEAAGAAGAAVAAPAAPAAPGGGAVARWAPGAKRLGASAKVKAAPPPGAGTSAPSRGQGRDGPRRVEFATFLGMWTDSMGNLVQVDSAPPATCDGSEQAASLDVKLTRKGSSKAPIRFKVTQQEGGSFSCGHFSLDLDSSRQDRLVWADRRAQGKTFAWERKAAEAPPPRPGGAPATAAGPRAPAAAAAAAAPAAAAPAAAAAGPRAAATAAGRGGRAGAGAAGGPATAGGGAAPAAAAAAAAAPSAGVRSLGARAKVKPSRPAPPPSGAELEAQGGAEAAGGASPAVELATFLGVWVDSMGNAVQVDWARQTGGENGRGHLDVKLIRPRGGREPIRLKVTQQESGLFNCGHFNLNVAKSSAAKIVWADRFNPSKESIWQRQNGAATPRDQAVPGLKRAWSLDSTPSPVNKLPRLSSDPPQRAGQRGQPGGGAGLVRLASDAAAPPASQQPRPPPAPLRNVPQDAKDAEGRLYDLQSVVVNFADVGMSYAKSVLAKSPKHGLHDFDWEGVRRCVRYMRSEREMQIFGVIPEDFQAQDSGSGHRCGLPFDIQLMCECVEEALPSPYSGEAGAAREMTVERAYERNCLYVDSGNGAAPPQCHVKCRAWLEKCRDLLHLRYFFDSMLGTFDVFDGNVGPPTLARMNSFS